MLLDEIPRGLCRTNSDDLAAGPPGSGYVAVVEPTHRESVNCHRDRRESFSGFKQVPSVVSFLCQSVTDFDRFFVKY